MPAGDPHPAHMPGYASRPDKTNRMTTAAGQTANRLLLAVLLILLGMPPVPPYDGVESLWAEAADLQAIKSYAAAVEVYEQIASLTPQTPEPLVAIGEIYLTQHRWPLAEDAFNRALAMDGRNIEALAGLAMARWEQGDHLRAVEHWEMALAQALAATHQRVPNPELSAVRLRLALAYLDIERPADAETLLNREVSYSDSPVAHLYLAMMMAADHPTRARQELEAITDGAPPSILEARDYLLEAGKRAEAATAAGAAKSTGLALMQIEEWQLTRAALQAALRLDPTDAETMAFLGHTEAQLGKPAFAHLSQAVEIEPDWAPGHYLLGLYYMKQGAYEFATEEFQTTLRLDPGNAQALVELAHAFASQAQYLEAERLLAEAVEAAPADLYFHKALVRYYADHTFRVTDRGLAAAKTAADLAPEDPEVRDMLGWMYFLAGDPVEARLHLESALRLDPEQPSVHYHLGLLRKALGDDEAARFALRRAIDLDTDGFYRSQAQKALYEMPQADE